MQALNDLELRAAELQRKAQQYRQGKGMGGRSVAGSTENQMNASFGSSAASAAMMMDTPITRAAISTYGHGAVTGMSPSAHHLGPIQRRTSSPPRPLHAMNNGGGGGGHAAGPSSPSAVPLAYPPQHTAYPAPHTAAAAAAVHHVDAYDGRLADYLAARQPSLAGHHQTYFGAPRPNPFSFYAAAASPAFGQPQQPPFYSPFVADQHTNNAPPVHSHDLAAFLGLNNGNNPPPRALARGSPSAASTPTRLNTLFQTNTNEFSDDTANTHTSYGADATAAPISRKDLREAVEAIAGLLHEEARQQAALATTHRHMKVYRDYLKGVGGSSMGHRHAVMEAVAEVQRAMDVEHYQNVNNNGLNTTNLNMSSSLHYGADPHGVATAAAAAASSNGNYEKHRAQFLLNQQRLGLTPLAGNGNGGGGASMGRMSLPQGFAGVANASDQLAAAAAAASASSRASRAPSPTGSSIPMSGAFDRHNAYASGVAATSHMVSSPSPPRDIRFTASATVFPSVSVPVNAPASPSHHQQHLQGTVHQSDALAASQSMQGSGGNYRPTSAAGAAARGGAYGGVGPFNANDIIEEVQAIARAREMRESLRRQQNAYSPSSSSSVTSPSAMMY